MCEQRGEIVTTLPGHKATVNCTLWLPTKKDVLESKFIYLFIFLFIYLFIYFFISAVILLVFISVYWSNFSPNFV